MTKTSKPTNDTNTAATTATAPTNDTTTAPTTGRHAAWYVRFPGATPARVTIEKAWSHYPEDLHIVGVGSRDVVHGRWGNKLYYAWAEAIAASIEQQQAKISQLDAELTAAHVHLERLRTLDEPQPDQQPQPQPQPQE